MIKITQFILLAFATVIFAGCKTPSQSFSVQAPAGTEIFSPNMEHLATVSSGQAQIKISGKTFYAYLLARSQGSQDYVPFALDYKTRNGSNSLLLLQLLGETYLSAGGIGLAAAGFCLPNTPMLIGGVCASAIGIYFLQRDWGRSKSVQYNCNYRYSSLQKTNQDFVFGFPNNNAPARTLASASSFSPNTTKQTTAAKNISLQPTSAANSRMISERSNRVLNIGAKKAEGTYLGSGSLRFNNEIIEELADIRVLVKQIDKNTVSIDVIEANGNSFFQKSSRYSVKQEASQKLTLTHENIKNAIITINGSKMTYLHPNVNIDGTIYSLQIVAKRD